MTPHDPPRRATHSTCANTPSTPEGGTLDVSLLFVNEESVQVIATHGDDRLGGADFDHCLGGMLGEQVAAKVGAGWATNGAEGMCTPGSGSGASADEAGMGWAAANGEGEDGVLAGEGQGEANTAALAAAGELECLPSSVRAIGEHVKKALSSAETVKASCKVRTGGGEGGGHGVEGVLAARTSPPTYGFTPGVDR